MGKLYKKNEGSTQMNLTLGLNQHLATYSTQYTHIHKP